MLICENEEEEEEEEERLKFDDMNYIHLVQKTLPLFPVVRRLNPNYNFTQYFSEVYLTRILPPILFPGRRFFE
jgi:hypothetical protein